MATRWPPSTWPTAPAQPRRHWFWQRSTTRARQKICPRSLPLGRIGVGMPRRFPGWRPPATQPPGSNCWDHIGRRPPPTGGGRGRSGGLGRRRRSAAPPLATLVQSRNKQIARPRSWPCADSLPVSARRREAWPPRTRTTGDLRRRASTLRQKPAPPLSRRSPRWWSTPMSSRRAPGSVCRREAVARRTLRQVVGGRGRPGRVGRHAFVGGGGSGDAPATWANNGGFGIVSFKMKVRCRDSKSIARRAQGDFQYHIHRLAQSCVCVSHDHDFLIIQNARPCQHSAGIR
jgi:hypothetical protein